MAEHYKEITVRVPIEKPNAYQLARVSKYRQGQHDRRNGKPCASANGAYLDGWYDPENECPPYISDSQRKAYNL